MRSTQPVSKIFGWDRGIPIDRYYIEYFLKKNQNYIQGKVLEIAESKYSKQFGTGVTSFEILHVEQRSNVTIVGDLTKLESLPRNTIDCFICTQVLNFIYDFHKAIEGAHHLLKPEGVMLATVSGISQISRYDADRWGHFWSFYPQGIERAFKRVFGEHNVEVTAYGNSLSAISFVKGIAHQELTEAELNFHDADYPVTITIVARKA
ncbi:MAG TPA: methyltransferase domain-containing protein [Cyclobacteriaceae bacterium]|nr:methyltransferase domain-containing protein [Cyclobacteriaceae bacterium]